MGVMHAAVAAETHLNDPHMFC